MDEVSLEQSDFDPYNLEPMSTTDIETLQARAARMNAQYDALFSGQPRHSRDPALLDELIKEASALVEAASRLETGAAQSVISDVRESRTLYEREVTVIREIQDGSTEVFLAHEYRAWARMVYERYNQNFAGHSRNDRDLALLEDMLKELERLDAELNKLQQREDDPFIVEARDEIASNRTLYQNEHTAISSLRSSESFEERGDHLATAANVQFAQYGRFFAKKQRRSRSISRLSGMLGQLDGIKSAMLSLKDAGFESDSNARNIGIVEERAVFYRQEHEAIQAARREGSFDDLVTSLGKAANDVFDNYKQNFAGQSRGTRDLELMSTLCEELYDLARQMDQLDRVRDHDQNQHNLAVVLDRIRTYNREYREIKKAKAST